MRLQTGERRRACGSHCPFFCSPAAGGCHWHVATPAEMKKDQRSAAWLALACLRALGGGAVDARPPRSALAPSAHSRPGPMASIAGGWRDSKEGEKMAAPCGWSGGKQTHLLKHRQPSTNVPFSTSSRAERRLLSSHLCSTDPFHSPGTPSWTRLRCACEAETQTGPGAAEAAFLSLVVLPFAVTPHGHALSALAPTT